MRSYNFLRLISNKITSRSYNYFLKVSYFYFLRNWFFQLGQKTQGILRVKHVRIRLADTTWIGYWETNEGLAYCPRLRYYTRHGFTGQSLLKPCHMQCIEAYVMAQSSCCTTLNAGVESSPQGWVLNWEGIFMNRMYPTWIMYKKWLQLRVAWYVGTKRHLHKVSECTVLKSVFMAIGV
jgi:hypothetical protein